MMFFDTRCLSILVNGSVQGVGFRPFAYRLARELGLSGSVANCPQGVRIEVEGGLDALKVFERRLKESQIPHSQVMDFESSLLEAKGYQGFVILSSDTGGRRSTLILPDMATCPECKAELFDPANRRYRYPFITCTQCGPRFSLIEQLPYDRKHTTMRHFTMCRTCREEYENPTDRRFHSQTHACADCGPRLFWTDASGAELADGEEAVHQAVRALRAGKIIAVKGIGGYQFMVDASNAEAVMRLRQRKNRHDKPFAVMMPDLSFARRVAVLSAEEERALASDAAPIVIAAKADQSEEWISRHVAPHNACWGLFLPYSGLHHLILSGWGLPLVVTSGNLSEEPICVDDEEALRRLGGIADYFLKHNRPIARPVDDSVIRVLMNRPMIFRGARGLAPFAIPLSAGRRTLLSVGAHLKNTVALTVKDRVYLSQHIGDLDNEETLKCFEAAVGECQKEYGEADWVVSDLHPAYVSTQFAQHTRKPTLKIQHHYAHILSCMADNGIEGPVLGVAWDGSGYGPDGSVWGGEFLEINESGFTRFAHLRPFPLPGSEAAVREPRRAALGLCHEIYGDAVFLMKDHKFMESFTADKLLLIEMMLKKKTHSPLTTSAGRLFDAVSSLVGLRQVSGYEGQAAIELEGLAAHSCRVPDILYELPFKRRVDSGPFILDWEPMIRQMLADVSAMIPGTLIALKFHLSLVEAIMQVARASHHKRVVLSGGCFQNKILLEQTIHRLRDRGLEVFWHKQVPTNDGGIALGQLSGALKGLKSCV